MGVPQEKALKSSFPSATDGNTPVATTLDGNNDYFRRRRWKYSFLSISVRFPLETCRWKYFRTLTLSGVFPMAEKRGTHLSISNEACVVPTRVFPRPANAGPTCLFPRTASVGPSRVFPSQVYMGPTRVFPSQAYVGPTRVFPSQAYGRQVSIYMASRREYFHSQQT